MSDPRDKFKRNIDFPLNTGYNLQEYYETISNQIYTNRSKLQLILRRSLLQKQFQTQYRDLLQAIKNNNYEAIESICEENLTLEIAAKMYEFQKFSNLQFRVANDDGIDQDSIEGNLSQKRKKMKKTKELVSIDANIVNHFYVHGMDIDRSKNESLEKFKMMTKSTNHLHYVDKQKDTMETTEYFF